MLPAPHFAFDVLGELVKPECTIKNRKVENKRRKTRGCFEIENDK